MFKIINLRYALCTLQLLLGLLLIQPVYGQIQQLARDPALPPTIQHHGFNTTQAALTQVTPKLTLREAILLALRNNLNVKNAELQRVVDKFSLAVAHNQFWPQVSLSAQALYQNSANPAYSAFPSVSLQTPLGTTITTGLTQNYNSTGNPPMANYGTINITQPLLRGFGPAVTRSGLLNANDMERINQLTFNNALSNVIVNVADAYYQLVQAYNNLTTDQLSLQDTQATLKQTQQRIQAGKAAAADEVEQQQNIANRQLAINQDQNTIDQSYQNLLTLLGLDPNAKIDIEPTISDQQPPLPTLAQSIETALAHNQQYQQALISYSITQRSLLVAKDAQKWQLDAVASLNQPIGNGGNLEAGKSLALNLNVPIHDMTRKQQLVSAKVSLDQAKNNLELQKRQLIAAVTNAYNAIKFNQTQIELYARSSKLSEQSVANAKLKFNYGKISIFELTSLQNTLITTRIGQIAQKIQYLNSVEAFYQLLGTTLARWQIVL